MGLKKTWKQTLCSLLIAAMVIALLSPTALAAGAGANRVDLPAGCYTLATRLNGGQCLDVSGNNIENGTNIQIWERNFEQAQMFYTIEVGGGWFGLLNIYSRKAVDVAGGKAGSGVNVQLYDWNNTDAQLWRFEAAPGGGCYLRNKLGYYLDVSGGGSQSGTNVQVYEWNGTDAQIWDVTPAAGLYTLTTGLHSGMRLDVSGNNRDNGTNVQIYSANNSFAQTFCLVQRQGEWYTIHHSASRRVLDVAGGVSADSVNVQLYDMNGSDAQLWRLVSAGDGSFYIQNKLGYYLDVSGGNAFDENNVQVYSLNGSAAQRWRVEPADLTGEITGRVLESLNSDHIWGKDGFEKLRYYWKNFDHGKKYDIKVRECWYNLFGDIAFPGTNGVVFCGDFITPEQLGNLIYGYTGKKLGFDDTLIYMGGGLAAGHPFQMLFDSVYHGDSPMDHEFISIGIRLANAPTTIQISISDVPSSILDLARNML